MTKKNRVIGLILIFILQLSILGFIIYKHEDVVNNGTLIKMMAQPVDPVDAFRGRYVAINVDTRINKVKDFDYNVDRGYYVSIQLDAKGFGHFVALSDQKPRDGLYVKVKIAYVDESTQKVILENPFQRLYMEEQLALKAESYYNKLASSKQVYIEIYVKNGMGVIKEIYFDQIPFIKYLEAQNESIRP